MKRRLPVVVPATPAAHVDVDVDVDESYAQTRPALANIALAPARAGATPRGVVRTRIHVTDIAQREPIGRAHGKAFGAIRPASTMIEVSALVGPRMLAQIEADAFIDEGNAGR